MKECDLSKKSLSLRQKYEQEAEKYHPQEIFSKMPKITSKKKRKLLKTASTDLNFGRNEKSNKMYATICR